jgi:zinc/manganese transport system substrate-binding protein
VLDLSRADLLLEIGLGLEVGWLPTLQTSSRNGAIQDGARGHLDCSTLVRQRLEVPQGRVDRSQGDIHPGGSPHYLFHPDSAVQIARGIAARMAQLDAEHAAEYRAGGERFVQRLTQARRRWEQQLASLRGAKAIGHHRSFAYLAAWVGLNVIDHVEPRPGIPPNPAHVARLIGRARSEGARMVLIEAYYPDNTARIVAERAGGRLVVLEGGTDFAHGRSYVDHMGAIVNALVRGAAR